MEAEAKGHFELLDKKAQGLGALVTSCGSADAAFKLLMLEHVDTIAETFFARLLDLGASEVVVLFDPSRDAEKVCQTFQIDI